MQNYPANKTWRLNHPDRRSKQRKRYYRQFQQDGQRQYRKWTVEDSDFILTSHLCDRSLHELLNRSVQAIQMKRHRLLKKWIKERN